MQTMLLALACAIPTAEPVLPAWNTQIVIELAQLAGDERAGLRTRLMAMRGLAQMGPEAKPAVPILKQQLMRIRTTDPLELQERLVNVFGQIGPAARCALPDLVRLSGRDFDLDREIAQTIDRISAKPEDVEIRECIAQMRSKDPSLRLRAAKAVAAHGPKAQSAANELLQLLLDPDGDVRRMAIIALKAVEPDVKHTEAIVRAWVLDLADADDGVRLNAVRQLGKMGPAASAAATSMEKLQNDPSAEVKRAAAEAASRLGAPP